ncbi:TraB/GumN family protein [Nitrosococcus watsonii]|uniref:TraB family protein n=1 Tax=Nitrosococcus watsoni (strain C-113) TaxID=105559 RepID=D8K9Y0_NITWC|nr:TraB/GumN family protein [Nitrosococcus watsonii]ADJ29338.1 TraB family protein [Nitrosococcus watsonii C-113]
MNSTEQQQPLSIIKFADRQITLLGTAHVSRASAEHVKALLATGDYDAVAVELCPSRYQALINPNALSRMDLLEVLRKGKAAMVTASLALGAYQQRIAEQFGIEPGAEMRAAVDSAHSAKLPVLLIDREVGTTLKRIYRNVPWWQRFNLIGGLFASLMSRDTVSEEEVERLKEGDVLETTFSQFAMEAENLYLPLIDERDRYMAARLREEMNQNEYRHLLGVIGAGHLRGVTRYLEQDNATPAKKTITELDQIPPPSRWPQIIPWLIVVLVLVGFIFGFYRSPELGWQLIIDWILINGGLAALGALIAGAHPLTIAGAFAAAPLTSLNPTIGAGMVTAAIETFLRRPTVGDFSRLRQETVHIKGWWSNRVTRILLVFLLSTLGSAVGTYVAGFKIIDRLTGA